MNQTYPDRSALQRAVSLGVVVLLHGLGIGILVWQSATIRRELPLVMQTILIRPRLLQPRPAPALPAPLMQAPALAPVPVPEISVAATLGATAPKAVLRAAPRAPAVSHFGPAGDDAGLGVQAATSGGGGARRRGNLADFQAAVRRAVLARRVQPRLAWDRRDTCVINYTVSVALDGALAGMRIDPCAVPEINAAAEAAIRSAAPFPVPPALGSARTDVHGTLIFRP